MIQVVSHHVGKVKIYLLNDHNTLFHSHTEMVIYNMIFLKNNLVFMTSQFSVSPCGFHNGELVQNLQYWNNVLESICIPFELYTTTNTWKLQIRMNWMLRIKLLPDAEVHCSLDTATRGINNILQRCAMAMRCRVALGTFLCCKQGTSDLALQMQIIL